MTDYGDNLLQGSAPDTYNINKNTQNFLSHLPTITGYIPDIVTLITMNEYIKLFKRLMESTYAGTSNITLAMMKPKQWILNQQKEALYSSTPPDSQGVLSRDTTEDLIF